jgi:hypothetical protein
VLKKAEESADKLHVSTDETAFIANKGILHLIDQSESHHRRRDKRKQRVERGSREDTEFREREKHYKGSGRRD